MNRLLPAILVAVGALQPRLVAQPAHAPTGTVTFARDVAPILYRRCATCHRPDGAAPFSLLTFEEARRRGSQMAAVTASRYMPPWKPGPSDVPFAGVRGLTDAEIDTIQQALPPAIDAALAWTVREGVTNVIRHSRAQHCLIRLTQENERVWAEVINDRAKQERVESIPVRPGLGLADLRERVSALGGRMEAGPLDATGMEGFRVHVDLPMQRNGEEQVLQRFQEEQP